MLALVAASFATLDLQLARFFSAESMGRMARFLGELLSPSFEPAFLLRLRARALKRWQCRRSAR